MWLLNWGLLIGLFSLVLCLLGLWVCLNVLDVLICLNWVMIFEVIYVDKICSLIYFYVLIDFWEYFYIFNSFWYERRKVNKKIKSKGFVGIRNNVGIYKYFYI